MTKRPEKTLYRPNLYLLGFMGTGKSSVGRKVAARLKLKFLDSDAEIEKSAGMQINDIFAKYGEEKFRQMERDFMESGHPESGCVISCGGGCAAAKECRSSCAGREFAWFYFRLPKIFTRGFQKATRGRSCALKIRSLGYASC